MSAELRAVLSPFQGPFSCSLLVSLTGEFPCAADRIKESDDEQQRFYFME